MNIWFKQMIRAILFIMGLLSVALTRLYPGAGLVVLGIVLVSVSVFWMIRDLRSL